MIIQGQGTIIKLKDKVTRVTSQLQFCALFFQNSRHFLR